MTTTTISLRVRPEHKEAWVKASKLNERSLTSWVVRSLNKAAKKESQE